MKKFQLILILLISNFGFCQKFESVTLDQSCDSVKDISTADLLKKYPFNKASKIKLVYFNTFEPLDDTLSIEKITPLEKIKNKIALTNVKKATEIDSKEIEKLLQIFFATDSKSKPFYILDTKCYVPRNAIVFYNELGNPFEFIEICFNCRKIYTSSKKIELGYTCNDKYEMLKKVFEENGFEIRIFEKPY